MKSRRFIIIAATSLAAVGGGAAIAATQEDDGREHENAILSDAAERLDVETEELRTALSEAQQAQLDQAVEDGKLTQEQADRIKEHMEESGRVLGGPPGPGMHHGFHAGPPPFFEAIADELGISLEELRSELADGKSLRELAKAHDKSLDDLRAAARAAIEKRIAQDVEDGRITEAQADEMRERLPEMLSHLGERPRFHRGGPPMGGPGGPPMGGPPPMMR